jgi:hypothetical protein
MLRWGMGFAGGFGAGGLVTWARKAVLALIKTPAIKHDVRIFDCISFKNSPSFKC